MTRDRAKYERERRAADPHRKRKHREYMVQWRTQNPTAASEIEERRRTKDSGKIRARNRAYYEANSEKKKELASSWAAANPDRRKVHRASRKAQKLSNGGALSPDICITLMRLQRGLCACCSEPLGDSYHLDHIVPLARGGENSDHNVQLLLARCNMQKNAMPPAEFMQLYRGKLL